MPRSAVGAGLRRARDMLDYGDAATVAAVLGCGRRTSAHDTVPFALWSAARGLGDFERGLLDDRPGGRRRGHDLRHRGRSASPPEQGGAPPGDVAGADRGAARLDARRGGADFGLRGPRRTGFAGFVRT